MLCNLEFVIHRHLFADVPASLAGGARRVLGNVGSEVELGHRECHGIEGSGAVVIGLHGDVDRGNDPRFHGEIILFIVAVKEVGIYLIVAGHQPLERDVFRSFSEDVVDVQLAELGDGVKEVDGVAIGVLEIEVDVIVDIPFDIKAQDLEMIGGGCLAHV